MKRVLDRAQFALLAVAVAATIATHLPHLPAWLAPALALAIGLRVGWRRGHPGSVRAILRLPLAAALLVAVVGEYGNVFGRDPGSAFGCGLLALKLLETETPRDARVALAFCAFVLMSALLFEQGLPFTLLVCAVLILQVAALNRLEPAPLPGRQPLWRSLALAARLALVATPLALVGFVLVPRLGTPLWGSPGSDGLGRTGLADSMAPGQFNDLMLDDSPALRVTFDAALPPPSAQYFRTLVLSDFDGTTWTRVMSGLRHAPRPVQAGSGQRYDYRITLEPSRQRWLPALDVPVSVPAGAVLAGDDTLIANLPVTQPREYAVTSISGGRDVESLPGYLRQRLLRLPPDVGLRARALAAQWRAEAGNDAGVVERALALFRSDFSYTLSPPLLGRDSIDEFLFDTRSGFCEHYASAFVFLMRAAGIPARVATGYQGGWWSGAGGYLLVRQSDAHAWAEIWRDGVGWLRVDPTAAVAPQRIDLGARQVNDAPNWTQAGWVRALRNHVDLVNRWWTQGVVRFDALRQRALLSEFGISHNEHGDLLLMLAGALALLMLLATVWALHATRDRSGDALDRVWRRLRRELARAGVASRDCDGPSTLWQRVRDIDAELARSLQPVIDAYARLRYGVARPDDGEVARLSLNARQWSRQRLQRRRLARCLQSVAAATGINTALHRGRS